MFVTKNGSARGAMTLLAITLLASFTFAGCDDDTNEPPNHVEWDGALAGTAGTYAAVTGTAGADVSATQIAAEVDIDKAIVAEVYTWGISKGTCAAPGALIGTAANYPHLTVAADSSATAQSTFTSVLTNDSTYVVQVVNEAGATPVTVACGPLAKK